MANNGIQQMKASGAAGKNAVVLRPLNLGNVAGLRRRRTTEQVAQANIEKQNKIASRAAQRAQSLANKQKAAQERASRAAERAMNIAKQAEQKAQDEADRQQREADEANRIANDEPVTHQASSSTVMAIEKTPEVEKLLKNLTKEFDQFYKQIFDKYGVQIDSTEPELVKRGYISLKLRGYLQPQRKPVEAAATESGVAREAVRFMQHCKAIGLTPAWLNKEIRIKDDSNTYVLTGLRGKALSVVVRRKDDMSQAFTIASADFKKVLQPSHA